MRGHLEEYLCLASLPVLLFGQHTFTNAFTAFLFTFLLVIIILKKNTASEGERGFDCIMIKNHHVKNLQLTILGSQT